MRTMPQPRKTTQKVPEAASQPTPKESAATTVEEPQADSINGVVIIRKIDEAGNISADLQLLGDMKVTELETVLKVAQRTVASQLNL